MDNDGLTFTQYDYEVCIFRSNLPLHAVLLYIGPLVMCFSTSAISASIYCLTRCRLGKALTSLAHFRSRLTPRQFSFLYRDHPLVPSTALLLHILVSNNGCRHRTRDLFGQFGLRHHFTDVCRAMAVIEARQVPGDDEKKITSGFLNSGVPDSGIMRRFFRSVA